MAYTTAELLTAVLEYSVNQGSASVASDPALRKRMHFFLTKVCRRVHNAAPHWWRHRDDTITLTSGVADMPSDFSNFGTRGAVYVEGNKYWRLTFAHPNKVKYLIQNNPQSGLPHIYTLDQKTALGIPKILCWPTDSSTLVLKDYVRLMPEMIDAPLAPVVADSAVAGNPNGAYTGRVTFVTASGEVEGGDISASVSVTSKKLAWSDIPLWWGRTVTSRKLYRTAAGGTQHKLVDTLSDNTTTTYTDDVADGSLGADVPTPATAVSGMEYFPLDFHDSVIFDGLTFFAARVVGDGRDVRLSAEWDRSVINMWDEIKQGQNEIRAFPAFPGPVGGHTVWSRWSPPS